MNGSKAKEKALIVPHWPEPVLLSNSLLWDEGRVSQNFLVGLCVGKSHYGWESKWFCGFQLISVIDHITQRVMADRFICKQKYGGRLQWPWKWLHKKFIHSFLTSKVKTTSFIYFPSRSTSLLVAFFSHFCYSFDCRMWIKIDKWGWQSDADKFISL